MGVETYRLVDLIHDMVTKGGCPSGISTRYVWAWTFNRVPCTRAVNAGRKHGYFDGHFPSHGFAAMNLTDKGRHRGAAIIKARALKQFRNAEVA